MGTMSRQREALIQNGLTGDAGDVDAEFDHIVAQHNESETRLVAAEADIITNAGNITDATESAMAGQETYATASDYTYLVSDERQFVVTTAAKQLITLPDPEGVQLRTAGERFQIICATDAGCEVYSAYFQNAIDSTARVYLRNGDILQVVCINNGSNVRYLGNVLRSQRDQHSITTVTGAGSSFTYDIETAPEYLLLQPEAGSITVTLPTLTDWWIGRVLNIITLSDNNCSLVFDDTNDAVRDDSAQAYWETGDSPLGISGGKTITLIGMPSAKLGTDPTYVTRRFWNVLTPFRLT
jgi:hypothetical protein